MDLPALAAPKQLLSLPEPRKDEIANNGEALKGPSSPSSEASLFSMHGISFSTRPIPNKPDQELGKAVNFIHPDDSEDFEN